MVAFARNQSRGRPRSRLFQVAHRISDRLTPVAARAFIAAIETLASRIDEAELVRALQAGDLATIEASAQAGRLAVLLSGSDSLRGALLRASTATGEAGAEVLAGATGLAAQFNRVDPNVVLFARTQVADLVVQVGDDVREAIRIVVAMGAQEGLTIQQQARAIREVVGLRPGWVRAPTNFADELRSGTLNRSRLLADPLLPLPRQRRAMQRRVEAEIEARIAAGTLDEAFIARMQRDYARNLLHRRALDIAGTETRRAAMHGLREGWRQAVRQDVLPAEARRHPVVTPDDRLRPTHAAIPGMNPDGVPLDGTYATPFGPQPGPPWPADPYNCRCGETLTFPGRPGRL